MKVEGLPDEAVARCLLAMQKEYETALGETKVHKLFSAIQFCGDQEVPIPDWANNAFQRATIGWAMLEYGSLDDAFGVKSIPENTRKNRVRNRRIEAALWTDIRAMRGKNIPWCELAEKHGASTRKLQQMYYKGHLFRLFGFRKK